MKIRYLTQEDLVALGVTNMKEVMPIVNESIKRSSSDLFIQPPKIAMRFGDESAKRGINGLAACIGSITGLTDKPACGIKWVNSNLDNKRLGIPRGVALIILNDRDNTLPVCIMEGTLISAMRTGAVGGIAAKHLGPKKVETIGLLGTGVQARTQSLAMKQLYGDFEIHYYSPHDWSNFSKLMNKYDITAVRYPNPKDAIIDTDLVITATSAYEPLLKLDWLSNGWTYIHVAGWEDEFRVAQSADKIIVDSWNGTKHRKQTLSLMYHQGLIKDSDIYAELRSIISGELKGRESEFEKIYFSTVGIGITDVAVARYFYEKAEKKDVGTTIPLWGGLNELLI